MRSENPLAGGFGSWRFLAAAQDQSEALGCCFSKWWERWGEFAQKQLRLSVIYGAREMAALLISEKSLPTFVSGELKSSHSEYIMAEIWIHLFLGF